MADEGKKKFVEPELIKSEKPLDEVTMGVHPYGDGMTQVD